jgi:hypothetical protein
LSRLIYLRTKIKAPFVSNRWKLCFSVALITACCTYCITFLQKPEKLLLKQLFSKRHLEDRTDPDDPAWDSPNVTFNLVVFVVIKFMLEAIAISSPITAGVFYPTFILGAAFGRLYGHVLRLIIGDQINEASYAIIGAACVVSSVTRTVSVAMIVFELKGDIGYLIPVLFAMVISYAVSNSLAMSIFDVLLDMKDLPYLPALRSVASYNQNANDIMNKNFLYLTERSKLKDIVVILQYLGPKSKSIPIVESEENKVLLYSVHAQALRKYLFWYYNSVSYKFDVKTREKLNQYFSSLYAISQMNMRKLKAKKFKPNTEEELVVGFMKNENSIQYGQNSVDTLVGFDEESVSMMHSRKVSVIHVSEFNKNEIYNRDAAESTTYSAKSTFWNTPINYDHEHLEVDRSPFTVMQLTPITKVHFLFTMLNISQLFVVQRGVIVGMIAKYEFLISNKATEHDDELEDDSNEPLGAEYIHSILSHSIMNPTLVITLMKLTKVHMKAKMRKKKKTKRSIANSEINEISINKSYDYKYKLQ